ncbi:MULTISPECIES: ParB/RepB/Spo0J family partition protein [Micromonospora]|uniref:ParB/RepB/Spo0J family partition protein n=1 Tax=Micromonospora carbonacea TaxID=47853 RepID=A0A7H8XU22_9ACTN|nr:MULTISPECIES: ParB/RepB/Spo0J family partition protein [Micromonospora]MBB5829810.1 ParB family chromosome partitioning protein [Micromonospora carbonacea]QLD28214.1 ParB/RepB/Spo0J family partition protein [Micromonospora carbonacea]WFE58806.1 ParB/RepB/Spo0J family partition protein [Micromonospora sp. WMMD712]
MKNRPRGGLGRGLGALIPTGPVQPVETTTAMPEDDEAFVPASAPAPVMTPADVEVAAAVPLSEPQLSPVPGARFAEVPVDAIVPNPKQPRQVFDEDALEELKTSIQEVGFLQPIVVRALDGEKYELVMGERRWRAAQAVGRENIPAIVRDTRDDAMLRDALLENIHRANLNPLEEAAAYQQLLEEFGATHEELARRIGRSRPQISNTIRLLNLPAQVQRRVAAGLLSAGHARALLSLDEAQAQEQLAARIVAEGLSVRSTEEIVALALADGPAKAPAAKRRTTAHAPALTDLADRLSDRFDTRVKVDIGRSKGKITIEFATVDDLERIVGIIGVGQEEETPED